MSLEPVVSWNRVTTNQDGTPITDLAGYRVYYGTVSQNYSTYVNVPNQNATSQIMTGLTQGLTYYFRVRAYDDKSPANVSGFSAEVSTTIDVVIVPEKHNLLMKMG